jgi:hypothetical protein
LAVHAQAVEDRVAFIIGNGGYPKSLALKNPLNDATAIEKQLTSLGFETKSYKDLKVAEVSGLRQQMESRLKRNSVLFFYYAGHGVQIDGRNYLLPVDATLNDGDKASQESLYLGDVLHAIERIRPKIAVVILDACRDNPFKDQKNSPVAKQGLARVDPPTSTVVFYATRPGGTAQDGDDENGVFTKALLQEIVKPEQPLEVLFRRVSTSVFKSTKSEQEPWIEGVIREEFIVNQGIIQKPLQPIAVAVAVAATPTPQVEKILTSPPVKGPEPPIEALAALIPSINNAPSQTQLEIPAGNDEKLVMKSLDKAEALRRLNESIQKKELSNKSSFYCDGNYCFEYAEWAKSLASPENLDSIKSAWKGIGISNKPTICEFDLKRNTCIKDGLNSFILSPIAIIPGASNSKFESWRYQDIKITNSGGMQFSLNAQLVGLFNVVRPSCSESDAKIEFGRQEIVFNISRVNCFGAGPITLKLDTEVLLFNKEEKSMIVKWSVIGFGMLSVGSGSGIGLIKL